MLSHIEDPAGQWWAQQITDTLAEKTETVSSGKSFQRNDLDEDDGSEAEVTGEEEPETAADHHEGSVVVGEDRHEDRRDTAGDQTAGVRLGHVHPGLIAGPAKCDLEFFFVENLTILRLTIYTL